MSSSETINHLENRVRRIEKRLYGGAPRDGNYPEISSTLTELSTKLGNALSTRDRMMAVMKRLEELDEYLDPCYGTPSQLPSGAMTDLILAQEDLWVDRHQKLQNLMHLKDVLDSQQIADCMNHGDKLVEVSIKQSDLETLGEEQSEKVTDLLQSYNAILQTLTETLVRMDEIVTRAEIAAQPKKVAD